MRATRAKTASAASLFFSALPFDLISIILLNLKLPLGAVFFALAHPRHAVRFMRECKDSGTTSIFSSKTFALALYYKTSPTCVLTDTLLFQHLRSFDFRDWWNLKKDIFELNSFLAVSAPDLQVTVTRKLLRSAPDKFTHIFRVGKATFGFLVEDAIGAREEDHKGDFFIVYEEKKYEIRHRHGMISFYEFRDSGRVPPTTSCLRKRISKDGAVTIFAGESGRERMVSVEHVDGSKTFYEGSAGEERMVSMTLSPGATGVVETLDARSLRSYRRAWRGVVVDSE